MARRYLWSLCLLDVYDIIDNNNVRDSPGDICDAHDCRMMNWIFRTFVISIMYRMYIYIVFDDWDAGISAISMILMTATSLKDFMFIMIAIFVMTTLMFLISLMSR